MVRQLPGHSLLDTVKPCLLPIGIFQRRKNIFQQSQLAVRIAADNNGKTLAARPEGKTESRLGGRIDLCPQLILHIGEIELQCCGHLR